jgi:uncharacterized protein YjbI with pentapeptide repeats
MPSKKKIPSFKSDRAAAAFVDKADLSQYDLSGAKLTRIDIRIQDDLAAGRLDSAIERALDDEKNGRARPL